MPILSAWSRFGFTGTEESGIPARRYQGPKQLFFTNVFLDSDSDVVVYMI
jgi:hypothetical protein